MLKGPKDEVIPDPDPDSDKAIGFKHQKDNHDQTEDNVIYAEHIGCQAGGNVKGLHHGFDYIGQKDHKYRSKNSPQN